MLKIFEKYAFAIFVVVAVMLYGLTIRGAVGVPDERDVTYGQIDSGEPFETSQERSRYAIILALYHHGAFNVDAFPQMGTPDVGFINGHYFSFFPPTVSIFALPLYHIGLKIGATQLMVFLISTVFALATGVLIYKYAQKLGLSNIKSVLIAYSFLFATNAWGYSVTLYAHLISAFFVLAGVYVLQFSKEGALKGALIWLFYAFAVFVDFPNIFIYFPIALIYSLRGISIREANNKLKIRISFIQILTPLIFFAGVVLYGYYNYTQFGSPTILSNNLPRVRNLNIIAEAAPELGRNVTGALNTRMLLNGYYTFIASIDRGALFYTPIVLLCLFGFIKLRKKYSEHIQVMSAVPLVCLTLYSMFSDPYGGWAFGSRYMIVAYPYLLLLGGAWFANSKSILTKIIFSIVFIYSVGVSLLAPLTTNVIPPQVEANSLGLSYTYAVNMRMLLDNKLNSFVYNSFLEEKYSALEYYAAIFATVAIFGLLLIWVKGDKKWK